MGLEQYTEPQKTANICIDCANACGGCSWSRDFTPVPGWTAEKVTRRVKNGKYWYWGETYKITACPQFAEG